MGKERNYKYPWSYLSEPGRLVLAATLAGVLAGVSACLLKYGVDWLGLHITTLFGSGHTYLSFLIFPLLGMLLSVWYQKGTGENLAHGTDIISRRLRDHRARVPRNMMWTPVLGCLLTVGFGASAGAESPAALSGASIASRAGGWFRLPGNYVRILLACGAGAGIAGIFKSPVGGMLFTIEILRIEMSAVASISLVCSCMAAYTTAYVMSGFTWDVSFIPDAPFEPSRLGWILLLGLFCGFYSVYYRQTEKWVIRQLAKVRNIWKKALVAGAAVSLVVFLLPPMYGEGYKVVSGLVSGNANVLTMDSLFFSGETEAWILLLAVTAMLLLVRLLRHTPLWFNRAMAFVGGISLEIYLIHAQFVLKYVREWNLGYCLTAATMIALSLPPAWLLHKAAGMLATTLEQKVDKKSAEKA